MTVPGLRIDGGDHPVRGDLAGDPEYPGRALLQVLARHGGQQRRSLTQHRVQLLPVQRRQQRPGIAGQRIHQFFPRRRVVVITRRLSRGSVVVIAAQQVPQLTGQTAIAGLRQPADRRTDQRDRVHRGHCVIQRGGIHHPPPPASPAALAASTVTSKIRSGFADRASRARISTSTVCTNPG